MCDKIMLGLFAQLNSTNEYIKLYSMPLSERSVNEWIELFQTNIYFISTGKYSVWILDKDNNKRTKIIDNNDTKTEYEYRMKHDNEFRKKIIELISKKK